MNKVTLDTYPVVSDLTAEEFGCVLACAWLVFNSDAPMMRLAQWHKLLYRDDTPYAIAAIRNHYDGLIQGPINVGIWERVTEDYVIFLITTQQASQLLKQYAVGCPHEASWTAALFAEASQ
jgi:hypothetical protein